MREDADEMPMPKRDEEESFNKSFAEQIPAADEDAKSEKRDDAGEIEEL